MGGDDLSLLSIFLGAARVNLAIRPGFEGAVLRFMIEHPLDNPHPPAPGDIWSTLETLGGAIKMVGGAEGLDESPSYNIETTFYVFVAPHVTVTEAASDPSLYPGNIARPKIHIIRTQSYKPVPAPGTDLPIGDCIGAFPIHWHVMLQGHELPRFQPLPFTARYDALELRLSPNGAGSYPAGYEVQIIRPKEEPGLARIRFWRCSSRRRRRLWGASCPETRSTRRR